ncbi:cell division protein FtsB [Prauserella isguenensis]|uniref:Cell division protein FtsB n=1 Tax=Prauserella isguenensis TaxID=1470180 RepID=A0A839S127_9PSEU|nr:cell division protein FtsB [Prauserella isguenensis]
MTAPARPRTQPVERPRQTPRRTARQAPTSAPETGSPRRRSSAAERAYARRAQRAETLQRQTERRETPEPRRLRIRLSWPKSRASFVLMLMALMAVGVATTLWLSTQAISDSYRLEQLRQNNASLAERSEELQRAVASAEAPARLAERARDLGMVPGGNPARLVVRDDGTVRVVGESERASPPAPQQPSTGRPGGDANDAGDRDGRSGGAQGDGAGTQSRDRQAGDGQAGDAQGDRAQQRDRQAGDDTRGDRGDGGVGGRGGDTGTTGDGDRPADSGAGETAD